MIARNLSSAAHSCGIPGPGRAKALPATARGLHQPGAMDDAPRISSFSVGGGVSLLPYEGDHPLSAWKDHHGMPGYPKLRHNPKLFTPNISMATITSPKDAPVFAFLLSLITVPNKPKDAPPEPHAWPLLR